METAAAQERTILVGGLWAALEADPATSPSALSRRRSITSPRSSRRPRRRAGYSGGRAVGGAGRPSRSASDAAGKLHGTALRGFLRRAPEAIGRLAIAKLDIADWAFGGEKIGFFAGAARLATQFATLGRDDLAAAVRNHLLRSADARCFMMAGKWPSRCSDPAEQCGRRAAHDVKTFVTAICTPSWLARQYMSTTDAPLAGALVLLGLSQPPTILRSFWSPMLTQRIGAAHLRWRAPRRAVCPWWSNSWVPPN
ncbi:MAG: hypothetical protein U1E43_05715 [Rhodospirillales bacterium]